MQNSGAGPFGCRALESGQEEGQGIERTRLTVAEPKGIEVFHAAGSAWSAVCVALVRAACS